MECLVEHDLPSSYQSANDSSISFQKKYILTFTAILAVSLMGTLSAWGAAAFISAKLTFDCATVVFMVLALVFTAVLKERKYEQSWYMGRAIAESIKTR